MLEIDQGLVKGLGLDQGLDTGLGLDLEEGTDPILGPDPGLEELTVLGLDQDLGLKKLKNQAT